ncbi:SDR family NAD(P)-dependent oxidoreductase [Neorhodopirellula lusitana]|uniref:SDR family NAD(P)-dependent oxidoreductase n=1 Tax=Neorhodopirellula lusitana TaxID=445327 RepID=UPI0038506714
MTQLDKQTVFVSGSTKGIGKAIASKFVAEGSNVIVHSRSESGAVQAQKEVGAGGAVWGDLANPDGTNQVLEQLKAFGPVEVLINNAGIFSVEDFFKLEDDIWLDYFQTNVMSMVRLCRALMPTMLERNLGVIINVASEAAVKPLPQMIHYSMTKTAMLSISRGLAELTKGTAVRVNSLLPGPTWTDGVESYFDGLAKQEGRPLQEVLDSYFKEHEPTSLIQRFATVEEVSGAALFLSQNSAVNGSSLRVEGGIIRSI